MGSISSTASDRRSLFEYQGMVGSPSGRSGCDGAGVAVGGGDGGPASAGGGCGGAGGGGAGPGTSAVGFRASSSRGARPFLSRSPRSGRVGLFSQKLSLGTQ